MTRRQELLAIEHKLSALADDVPANISFSAAQYLANAAEAISNALQYAVDAQEISDLANRTARLNAAQAGSWGDV